ncbi:MAG: hypothetical protein IPF99_35175 [Deltaproteobacteria bacterium]|nr:hypothetical protein [Deltaproteobacteria bacterium]
MEDQGAQTCDRASGAFGTCACTGGDGGLDVATPDAREFDAAAFDLGADTAMFDVVTADLGADATSFDVAAVDLGDSGQRDGGPRDGSVDVMLDVCDATTTADP